jgi:hypothetical protein
MSLTQLAPPYPIFTDKNGDPLDAGYLYFGTANLNPETNPIQVYYDSALTQPAAQPLRTSNGYVMRNGSPALIYANAQFSVTVRNKNNELVIYSPVGYGIVPGTAATNTDQMIYNEGSSGAVDRVLTSRLQDFVSVKDFGAVGDGVSDDTTSIQDAIDSGIKYIIFPQGIYLVNSEIVCLDKTFLVFQDAKLKTNSNITVLRFGSGAAEALTYSHGGFSGVVTIEGAGSGNSSNDGLVIRNYSYGNFNASVKIINCGGRAFAIESYGRGTQYNWIGGGWEIQDNYGIVFDINSGTIAGGYLNDNSFNAIRTHEQLTAGLTHARMRGLQIDANRFYGVAFETQDATATLLKMDTATANGFYGLRLDGVTGTKCLDIAAGCTGNMFYGYTTDGSVVDASNTNVFFGDQGGNNAPFMRFGSALNDGSQQAWELSMFRPGSTDELKLGALKAGGVMRVPSTTVFNIGDREGSDSAPIVFDPTNKRLNLNTLTSTAIGSGPSIRFDGRFSSSGNFAIQTVNQDEYGINCSFGGAAYGLHSGTYISVADGVAAPAAVTGRARIYVDTADGDLKIVFGDGTVKTIVTDV